MNKQPGGCRDCIIVYGMKRHLSAEGVECYQHCFCFLLSVALQEADKFSGRPVQQMTANFT